MVSGDTTRLEASLDALNQEVELIGRETTGPPSYVYSPGLMKREEFAKAAMQGLCASVFAPSQTSLSTKDLKTQIRWIGEMAVLIGDATRKNMGNPYENH